MPIEQDAPPQTEAQRLYAENLELRELLRAVASELDLARKEAALSRGSVENRVYIL